MRLGPYEILGRLGAGGMGEVYRARDARLHREVALKVIRAAAAVSADLLRRFEHEGRAAGALQPPQHPRHLRHGQRRGRPLHRVRAARGRDPRPAAARASRCRCSRRCPLAQQLARGLAAAHARGHHPPRPQAGQRVRHARPGGEDPRLRPGQGDARRDRQPRRLLGDGHRRGRGAGHRRLHGARAGARPAGRPPGRHLLVRRHPLRDAGRAAPPSPPPPPPIAWRRCCARSRPSCAAPPPSGCGASCGAAWRRSPRSASSRPRICCFTWRRSATCTPGARPTRAGGCGGACRASGSGA